MWGSMATNLDPQSHVCFPFGLKPPPKPLSTTRLVMLMSVEAGFCRALSLQHQLHADEAAQPRVLTHALKYRGEVVHAGECRGMFFAEGRPWKLIDSLA